MVVLKILFMLITVAIMAVPFIIEYFRFRKDEESLNVTRFRLIVFTAIYAVASTVVLLIVTRLFAWIGSWGVIQWILHNIGIGKYEDYTTSVYMVIIVNVLFGFGFFIMQSLVRIGLSKMNVVVKKNEEGFTAVQRFERKLVERFRVQKWYFVGRLLKYLSLLLSGVFAALFIVFQIPAVFSADWIPYGFISSLFKLSYQYPVIALFLLWESAFFLLGIHAFSERCPDWEENNRKFKDSREDKIRAIDEDCKKNFNAFYASSMELKGRDPVYFTNHENISKIIKDIVENDPRNGKTAKEVFVNALDRMEKTNNGILFNGGFFSEFSMYFFRYLSIRLARGDNLIFVCNRDRQSEKLYQYLHKGLCEISSLYYANSLDDQLNRDLENPIWKIVVVDGMRDDIDEHEINGASILITTPDFLCSDVFEERNADFISYLDTVIFTDTMNSINFYEKHLSLLNTKLKHMIENAGQNPICARPVRYFFFDDTRTPGIDKVLNNMFSAEIETVDIMENCYRSIVSCYKYDGVSEDGEGAELPHFIPSDENLSVMLEVAINCIAGGASSVSVFVDEALPYKAIEESISAHIHKLGNVSLERNLHINEYYYNPDQYSVILALDAGNNLPSALRKYISVTTDKPSLVILFSRPYLLRDYYIDNMEKLWQGNQILRIPITEGTEKDIAQKILMEANSGGISKEELLRLASKMNGFEPYVQSRSINKFLEKILEIFGIHCSGSMDVYRYFEYTSFRNFDRAGKYSPETKISLRSKGMLYDIIRVQDHITLHAGNHETYDLPLPKKRLAQNFIEGQNLIYQGKIYSIH
ncbi:MAG: sugar ABC transporter permease, partial [Clostridia bacterium]|nr:sugar ABC transporter permease [Clostridia bacterium]